MIFEFGNQCIVSNCELTFFQVKKTAGAGQHY